MNGYSCLEISLISVVCTVCTFESNLGIKHELTIHLKESCCLGFDELLSYKYFTIYMLLQEKYHKSCGAFLGALGMNGLMNVIGVRDW